MTTEEVGTHLNCHNSKVSRLELAKRACTKKDFEALMDLYEVKGDKRAELRELMIRGIQRVPPWWHTHQEVISASYAEFLAYEAEAARCREYQPLLIPAQLQTEEYARAITSPGFIAMGPDQVDGLVEVRLRRQERLREDEPLALDALVMEAALRLQVGGPSVLRNQLRHVANLAAESHITFRVIPYTAGAEGASTGAFTLFGTEKDSPPDAAFVESAEAVSFRDDPLTLRRLNRLFANLSQVALTEEDSYELVKRIEGELNHE